MLYNKKARLLRKFFSKEKSSTQPNSEKGRYNRLEDSTRHNHQPRHVNSGPGLQHESPLSELADRCLASIEIENKKTEKCANALENISNSNIPNKPRPLSALLAAKLSCDEWGIQGRRNFAQTTSTKVVSLPVPQLSANLTISKPNKTKVIQVRNSKMNHPSYKPPALQRSQSMKERREAKEKSKKLRNFSSSLYCIHEVEVPESELVGIQ